jgi:hypothetical protein
VATPHRKSLLAAVYGTGLLAGLLGQALLLIFAFDEYEPKFARAYTVTVAVVAAGVIALLGTIAYRAGLRHGIVHPSPALLSLWFAGALLAVATNMALGDDILLIVAVLVIASAVVALGQKLTEPLLAAATIVVTLVTVTAALVLTLDIAGGWYAKRCVRYVYWRNFHEQVIHGAPLPTLDSFSTPPAQRLLHGVVSVKTDPWFNPFHYLVVARTAEHPHKGHWDVEGIFWSNGPNGIDDGSDKRDDIDVTNSGL